MIVTFDVYFKDLTPDAQQDLLEIFHNPFLKKLISNQLVSPVRPPKPTIVP